MKKEIISESRLREIISEEAARFKKKLTLEAEKKNLLKKLNEMYMEEDMMEEDVMEGDELDEANMITRFFNRTMGGKAQFEERMDTLSRSARNNYGVEFTDAEKDELRAKAKADGYGGSLNFTEVGPNMKLVYTDAYDAKDTSGSVTSIAREGYAMEADDLEEGIFKSLGQAAKAVGQTAKAVVLPAKAAKDDALGWIASQDQNLVNQAKAQDKQAYENLKLAFKKELKKNEVQAGYEHLYLTPFFAEFGALGKADQGQRDKAYVASAGIKTGSNAE